MRKKIPFAILLTLLTLSGCQQKNNYPTNIEITWGVVTNNYNNTSSFLSELSIVNHSNIPLQKNWELFFNYSPCRKIDTLMLPKEIGISHINGDFFRMYPTPYFKGLLANDTLTIPIIASEWIIKKSGAPGGFYLIFDKNDNNPVHAALTIRPFTKKEQINRTAKDNIPIPSAENTYRQNTGLSVLPLEEVANITPTPLYTQAGKDVFTLDTNTVICSDKGLDNEVAYLQESFAADFGLHLKIVNKKPEKGKHILLQKKTQEIGNNEAYTLTITSGAIHIAGVDNAGVFYGVQSLRSLFPLAAYNKTSGNIQLQTIVVNDAPRFEYRGMHLDVARNFHSKKSVLQLLDLMSVYKLNKLHFHLTDDEGWRIQIQGLPELTDVGAVRGHTRDERDKIIHQYGSASSNTGSGYYTTEDFIEILQYANKRHIEIIPEIDFPGHAHAAIKSMLARYYNYIEKGDTVKAGQYLLSDLDDRSEYNSVQNFDDNVICVCRESTYAFLEKVIDELDRMYKKAGVPFTMVHTGGDEVPVGAWEKSPICLNQFNNRVNPQQLKSYFLDRFSEILSKHGLKTAGWEEIALHLEPIPGEDQSVKTVNPDYLKKDFVPYVWNTVYGWGGEETAYKLANAGYKIILCNVTHLYFDMAYNKNPKEPGFYWGGFVTDEHPYLFEPFNFYNSLKTDLNGNPIPAQAFSTKIKLTPKGKSNIMGMQGHLWSETVKSPERIEYMVFPRLISLAERAWAQQPEWVKNRNLYAPGWNEFANRLGQRETVRLNYLHGGINYHIPSPGAMVINGKMHANTALPGMQIRYTTDKTLPTEKSTAYTGPVKVSGTITLCTFDHKGLKSLPVTLNIE